MSHDLKPCPFCGSPAVEFPDGADEGFSIMCSGAFKLFEGTEQNCPLTTCGYETREASVRAWNRRPLRFIEVEEELQIRGNKTIGDTEVAHVHPERTVNAATSQNHTDQAKR